MCPVVSAISFKRRPNTSPSISANDKTLEWSSGAGERVATGAPHQEACARALECIQNKRPVHTGVCAGVQMQALKFNYGTLRN